MAIFEATSHINPYIAGNPVHGDFGFFGRVDILRQVEQILAAPGQNAVILYGPRRIGKTSILLQLQHNLPSDRYTVIYQDLQDKARQPMGSLLANLAIEIADYLNLDEPNLTFDKEGYIFQKQFLPKVYNALPNQKQRLILLFDEFDVLDMIQRERLTDNAAGNQLFPTLRRWLQEERRLAFVFALGRNLDELDNDFLATFKGAQQVRVSVLSREETINLITAPDSIQYTRESIESIYTLTNGHPYFTQLFCSVCFDEVYAAQPVNSRSLIPIVVAEDVEKFIPKVFSRGENVFAWIWDGLPPIEKITASTLAELLSDNATTATYLDIEKALESHRQRLVTRDIEISPEKLVKWQLLKKDGDGYSFLLPLLHRWIRLQKPMANVRDEFDQKNPKADFHFRIAKEDYRENNLGDAVRNLNIALKYYPNHLQALLLMGDIRLYQNGPVEALKFYREAFNIAPEQEQTRRKLTTTLIQRAEDLSKWGGFSLLEALEEYYEIKKIDPENDAVQKGISDLLMRIENWLSMVAEGQHFFILKSQSDRLVNVTNDKTWKDKIQKLEDTARIKHAFRTAKENIQNGQFKAAIERLLVLSQTYPSASSQSRYFLRYATRQHSFHQRRKRLGIFLVVFLVTISGCIMGVIANNLLLIKPTNVLISGRVTIPIPSLELVIILGLFTMIVALIHRKGGERKQEDERYYLNDFIHSFFSIYYHLILYFFLLGVPLSVVVLVFRSIRSFISPTTMLFFSLIFGVIAIIVILVFSKKIRQLMLDTIKAQSSAIFYIFLLLICVLFFYFMLIITSS